MNILIVYETKYGNTKKAAETIGESIKEEGIDVNVLKVNDVDRETLKDYKTFVIGSPTYAGRPAKSIRKFINTLTEQGLEGKKIVMFDTYTGDGSGPKGPLQRAVKKMEKRIQKQATSAKIIVDGLQIAVKGIEGPIIEGELEKCKAFAKEIAKNL